MLDNIFRNHEFALMFSSVFQNVDDLLHRKAIKFNPEPDFERVSSISKEPKHASVLLSETFKNGGKPGKEPANVRGSRRNKGQVQCTI